MPRQPINTINITRDVAIHIIFTKDLDQYKKEIKSVRCPHCKRLGMLNCHGWLRGNSEDIGRGNGRRVRGARFFCCNRGRRQGCGKTFSAMLPANIPGHSVSCGLVEEFIAGVRQGLSRKAAWEGLRSPYSIQTAYDLWNRLRRCQSTVRTRLHRARPPPEAASPDPLLQTIDHLEKAFPSGDGPVCEYQVLFQCSFLETA